MKLLLITDQHFGVRNDNVHFINRYRKFYSQIVIPFIKASGIDTVMCLGDTFEEIAAMLHRIDKIKSLQKRVAVCLDTCHVFAAGYPLKPKKSLDETIKQFDDTIGLPRLKVIHANDSKREQGSHVDRHEGIGEGAIGRAAFKLLVTHPKLKKIPFILETPKEGADGKPDPTNDIRNIKLLRRLES